MYATEWQAVQEDSNYIRFVRNLGEFVLEVWSHTGFWNDSKWYWRVSGSTLPLPHVGIESTRGRAIKAANEFALERTEN